MEYVIIVDDERFSEFPFYEELAKKVKRCSAVPLEVKWLVNLPLRTALPRVEQLVREINEIGGTVVGFLLDVMDSARPDGGILLADVKSSSSLKDIPVVMYTNKYTAEMVDKDALRAGGALDVLFWSEEGGVEGVAGRAVQLFGRDSNGTDLSE